jgi:Zn-dependent protease
MFASVFGSVILHEIAHGWVAERLGDPTARMMGRITWNPIAHVDLFGTILLPLILAVTGQPVLGWAKPVPVNAAYFRDPLRGMMWVGAAGPLTNFALALAAAVLFRVLTVPFLLLPVMPFVFLAKILLGLLVVVAASNLYLGLFNLIPIPPLDGSRILMGLLPREWLPGYLSLERYGILIVFLLLYAGLLHRVLDPVVHTALLLMGFR